MRYAITLLVSFLPAVLWCQSATAEDAAAVEQRLGRTARYLSSDQLGGRGVGSPEIRLAAEYIQREFEALNLRTDLIDGGPMQRFELTLDSQLADGATAQWAPAADKPQQASQPLALGEDFSPLAIGGSGKFDLPVAFAGYGVTAPEAEYDDYANIDVTGKAVIIMRHEPQQANPHSAFNGTEHSVHAPFRKKVSNAVTHGAAAVIFVTDAFEIEQRVAQAEKRLAAAEQALAEAKGKSAAADDLAKTQRRVERYRQRVEEARDPLLGFTRAGGSKLRDMPVVAMCRKSVDALLGAAGKPSLTELEESIDKQLQPASFDVNGWRLQGEYEIERQTLPTSNVLGLLDGAGPLAEEVLVIGAHYDHLGRGGEGSAKPGSREIHNGADDNASGIAVLLETARQLATNQAESRRTILFIAFTGEERGLLGSAHYCREPLLPLEQTVAMFNFDMVGRLTDNKLLINGTGTAEEFSPWIDALNQRYAFELTKSAGGYGPSDHTSFYAKQIPVLHFFTDLHSEYHRPDDDFQLLNIAGMRRIGEMVTELALQVATSPERIKLVEVEQPRMSGGKSDPRPYFGSLPDFAGGDIGYAISGVAPKSPAAKAGLMGGDKIIKLGEIEIANLDDFDNALRTFTGGDKTKVVVQRDGKQVTLEVVLDPPK